MNKWYESIASHSKVSRETSHLRISWRFGCYPLVWTGVDPTAARSCDTNGISGIVANIRTILTQDRIPGHNLCPGELVCIGNLLARVTFLDGVNSAALNSWDTQGSHSREVFAVGLKPIRIE
jgi:hypothetical protein